MNESALADRARAQTEGPTEAELAAIAPPELPGARLLHRQVTRRGERLVAEALLEGRTGRLYRFAHRGGGGEWWLVGKTDEDGNWGPADWRAPGAATPVRRRLARRDPVALAADQALAALCRLPAGQAVSQQHLLTAAAVDEPSILGSALARLRADGLVERAASDKPALKHWRATPAGRAAMGAS